MTNLFWVCRAPCPTDCWRWSYWISPPMLFCVWCGHNLSSSVDSLHNLRTWLQGGLMVFLHGPCHFARLVSNFWIKEHPYLLFFLSEYMYNKLSITGSHCLSEGGVMGSSDSLVGLGVICRVIVRRDKHPSPENWDLDSSCPVYFIGMVFSLSLPLSLYLSPQHVL